MKVKNPYNYHQHTNSSIIKLYSFFSRNRYFSYLSNRISEVPSNETFHCLVSRRLDSRNWACWRIAWATTDHCARRRRRDQCCRQKWYVSSPFAHRWFHVGCTRSCRYFRWVSPRSEVEESVGWLLDYSGRFVDPSRSSVPGRWSPPRQYRLRRCILSPGTSEQEWNIPI